MGNREQAQEIIELVCKALGVDFRDHDPVTREGLITDIELKLAEGDFDPW